jgi:hypothetical protein
MLGEKLYKLISIESRDITCSEKLIRCYEKNVTSGNWIFRGQERKDGLIFITSLERAVKQFVAEKNYQSYVQRFEHKLLREFKRKFHLYTSIQPDGDIEYLALMQHYGAPTRFLDWTYSFFIALYFALEKTIYTERKNDNNYVECEVWGLNYDWFTACKNVLRKFGKITKDIKDKIEEQNTVVRYL